MKPHKIASAGTSRFGSIRIQLGGGILLAAFAPHGVRSIVEGIALFSDPNTLIGTIAAIVLGYLGFRQTSSFPGVRASYGILPSFGLSFGIVIATFLLFRIDYSRLPFVASFVLCVCWFFGIYRILSKEHPVIGMVPFGRATDLCTIDGPEWVALDKDLGKLARFDAIVADLHADIPDDWERFLADQALNEVPVLHMKQLKESLTGRVEIEHLSENNFGSLIPGLAYSKFKRAADIIVSLVLFVPLLVLLIPLAIAIKLDSPGSVFFRQPRMGYRGDIFTVYKLRTMRENGAGHDADSREAAITVDGDHRITRLGRFLRQYRIDELPQLINVLRGEMSWIGPRPEAAALSEWYESELPFYRYRHIVRPGITGWAQVNQGHVNEVKDVLWKLHYDFFYIKNVSFWLDVLIVGRTVRTVLSGFGSK